MKKLSNDIKFGQDITKLLDEEAKYGRAGNTSKCTYQISHALIDDLIKIETNVINEFTDYKLLESFEAFVFQKLIDFLYDFKESNIKIQNSLCQDFIVSLKNSKIQKYEVILPVYNLDKSKFKPYKKIKFYQNSKEVESAFGNSDINKSFIGKHSGCYIGIEFESFEVQSIHDFGKQQISRFINCLNLLDPKFHISLYDNMFLLKQTRGIICQNNKIQGGSVHTEMPKNSFTVTPTDENWENLCDAVLSENPNQTQQRVISALYWYSKISDVDNDVYEKIIFLVMGLERLLFLDNERDKTKIFVKRIMHLFPKWNFKNPDEFWRECYKIRSEMVHQNEQFVDQTKANALNSLFITLIFKFVGDSKKFSTDILLKNHYNFN